MPIVIALVLPVIMFAWYILLWPPETRYEMDPGYGTSKGSFFPLLILYQFLFYAVVGLSIFGAIYSRTHGDWRPAVMLLIAAIDALLFNVLLLLFYEAYLHSRYLGLTTGEDGKLLTKLGPSNYARTKYALILALGASAVLTLIGGAIWTAITLR